MVVVVTEFTNETRHQDRVHGCPAAAIFKYAKRRAVVACWQANAHATIQTSEVTLRHRRPFSRQRQ